MGWWIIIALVLLVVIGIFVWLFYPQQQIDAKTIQQVYVTTPDVEKYHNDCLHPCIRRMSDGRYVMVQSPWFMCQDGIENPILYISDDPMHWDNGIVVADTPEKGYNSDPNVFVDGNRIYVFWREFETPLCERLKVKCAVVGVYTDDEGESFSQKQIYLTRSTIGESIEICPILVNKDGKYRFYATWYKTKHKDRGNLGIAIWEGSSLEQPDFELVKKVPFRTIYICDKYKQCNLFGHIFFIPKPHKFDLWHFDLFDRDGKLYMVCAEEMKDVVLLAKAKDWENFKLTRKPILCAHVMKNIVGYRQTYYKPTAVVDSDGDVQLYYTSNPHKSLYAHRLFRVKI